MAYALLGFYLLVVGIGLLIGDGQLVGAKLPINFGDYKNLAGCVFLLAGMLLVRWGIKKSNRTGDR